MGKSANSHLCDERILTKSVSIAMSHHPEDVSGWVRVLLFSFGLKCRTDLHWFRSIDLRAYSSTGHERMTTADILSPYVVAWTRLSVSAAK